MFINSLKVLLINIRNLHFHIFISHTWIGKCCRKMNSCMHRKIKREIDVKLLSDFHTIWLILMIFVKAFRDAVYIREIFLTQLNKSIRNGTIFCTKSFLFWKSRVIEFDAHHLCESNESNIVLKWWRVQMFSVIIGLSSHCSELLVFLKYFPSLNKRWILWLSSVNTTV